MDRGTVSFAPDSIWRAPLTGHEPLDPTSDQVIAYLCQDIALYPSTLGLGIAPIYDVDSAVALVPVTLVDHSGQPTEPNSLLAAMLRAGVPIAPGAAPTGNHDLAAAFMRWDTDEAWDLFGYRVDPVLGAVAKWGGHKVMLSQDPGYHRNASLADGTPVDAWNWGVCATSFPLYAGVVRQKGLDRGEITHALGLDVRHARKGVHCAPAQRQDGQNPDPSSLPEGARLRLDPTLDIDALNLPDPLPLYARAAQRYGVIVQDQTGAGTSFRTDRVTPTWTGQNLAHLFPWRSLQLLAMNLRIRPDLTRALIAL